MKREWEAQTKRLEDERRTLEKRCLENQHILAEQERAVPLVTSPVQVPAPVEPVVASVTPTPVPACAE